MSTKTTHIDRTKIVRKWHLVDAKGQVLGRLATGVARILMGKDKRTYSPHMDAGDIVVVINAQDIKITGNNKPVQKIDFRHSGYPGGETMTPYAIFLKEKPERAIELAVFGMLSKTRLRKRQMTHLKVYRKDSHPHGAQFPQPKSAVPEAEAVPVS